MLRVGPSLMALTLCIEARLTSANLRLFAPVGPLLSAAALRRLDETSRPSARLDCSVCKLLQLLLTFDLMISRILSNICPAARVISAYLGTRGGTAPKRRGASGGARVMATEQVQVDNPVDLGERQSLLEDAFTPEQIAALRANGGLAAADDGGGAKTSAGNIADYMSLKVAFGRLTESPTNWHQAAVYALSSTAPEDELLRRRSPVSLAISVVIVLLQLLTIVAVLMAAVFPPCHDNNSDCPHDGMFCKASGNGLEAFQGSRCGTCGNYGPMGYEYDESTGKMYNQVSRMAG